MSNQSNPKRPCWKNKWIYITISALIVFLGVLSILYLPDILLLLWKTWGEKEHIITEPCPVNILQNSSSIIAYLTAIFSFLAFIGILLTIYCQRQDAKKQQSFSDKQLFESNFRYMFGLVITSRESTTINISLERKIRRIVPYSRFCIELANSYLRLQSQALLVTHAQKGKEAATRVLRILIRLRYNHALMRPYIVMFFTTMNDIIKSNLSNEDKENKIILTSGLMIKNELCLVIFYGLLIGDKIMIDSINYIDAHKIIEEPYGPNASRDDINSIVYFMKHWTKENFKQFINTTNDLKEVTYKPSLKQHQ